MRGRVKIKLRGEKRAMKFGEVMAKYVHKGLSLVFFGEMGSGKTVIARGLIRDLLDKKEEVISSPTFVIENRYFLPPHLSSKHNNISTIHHLDLFRISPNDKLPFDLTTHDLNIIEWGENLKEKPTDRIELVLNPDPSPDPITMNEEDEITMNQIDNLKEGELEEEEREHEVTLLFPTPHWDDEKHSQFLLHLQSLHFPYTLSE